jgi:short subunit dehydrogenase-like uncharacterized protein
VGGIGEDGEVAEVRERRTVNMLRPSHTCAAAATCATFLSATLLLLLLSTITTALRDARDFDIVIFGATGYTGSLLTALLFDDRTGLLSIPSGTPLSSGVEGVRFALAGRNMTKLQQLRQQYADRGRDVSGVELIQADLDDRASLDRLVARTRLVVTTVAIMSVYVNGSFEYTGSLLERCILHGTHLLDLDGELWMDDVDFRNRVDVHARASGTVYSPACGEVAVVPDMVVYRAWLHLGRPPLKSAQVHHFFFDGHSPSAPQEEPSIWEAYDSPVVRLSAGALGYGDAFTFTERSPTNAAHADFSKNKGEDVRKVARFVNAAQVEAMDGRQATTIIAGGEVDYEETSRLALEMALSLLRDTIPAKRTGGVWSPAAGWGAPLLRRLEAIGLGVNVAPEGEHVCSPGFLVRVKQHGPFFQKALDFCSYKLA